MKKLMIAAAIAGAVGIAQADFSPSPFEGFENAILGTQIDISQGSPYYWNASGNDTNENYKVIETVVTNYAGTGETPLTDAGANYLALTGVELLERYVLPQENLETETGYAFTDGDLYIDTLVKFTVTEDDAPALGEGDKLCIWVGVNGDTTNLIITAGYVSDTSPTIITTNYVTDCVLGDNINDWHRLTVRAIPGIDEYGAIVGFVVSVDGVQVASSESKICDEFLELSAVKGEFASLYTAGKIFPSVIPAESAGGSTITTVGFKGSGAIDNLQFTNTDPNQSGEDWKDPTDPAAMAAISNMTAVVVYPSLAGTELAGADAVKLTLWATDPTKGALAFADAAADNVTTATVEAFLLNCAVDDVATEKAEFTVNITWDETDQEWKVTGPSNKTYNGTLTIKGSPDLTTPKANWDDYDPTTDKFMFGVLEF